MKTHYTHLGITREYSAFQRNKCNTNKHFMYTYEIYSFPSLSVICSSTKTQTNLMKSEFSIDIKSKYTYKYKIKNIIIQELTTDANMDA